MSESVALLFKPTAPPLTAVAPLLAPFARVEVQDAYDRGNQIVVFDDGDHAYIQPYSQQELEVELLTEGWPPELVPERMSALVIHYRNPALATRIIRTLGAQCRFLVDTGQREIYTNESFARRAAREPDWEWSRVPASDVPVAARPLVVFPEGWP